MKRRTLIVLFLLLIMTAPAQAAEIGGLSLPDVLHVGNEQLILNGAGLRTKFFIKVYAGGLYLKKKETDARKIIDADEVMAVRMQFIRDGVSPEKLVDAWNKGFANATGGNLAPIRSRADKFNSFFAEEARKGDIYDIVYTPEEGVRVTIKGILKGIIKGLDFKKALFAIWLGDKPADNSLKQGMLGK